MFDLVVFGKRLRQARQASGLSINKVVQVVGGTNGTLSRYENGKVYPLIDRVYDLAALYGCSIDWLCGVEDDE